MNVSSNSDLCTNTRVDEKGFTARRDNFSLECLFNYFFIPRNRNFLYDLSRNLSYSYEKLFKFFWQKFAILQNFLLCLISPRWELSFDIHEAIVILDQFQKAILDEPEADLSDLEIDSNSVNEGCVRAKINVPTWIVSDVIFLLWKKISKRKILL